MRNILRKWLGIEDNEHAISTLEGLLLHDESALNGFAVLDPNKLENSKQSIFAGKRIYKEPY